MDKNDLVIHTRLTNMGVEISSQPFDHLEPTADADQMNPRGYYVYAHVDVSGKIFYIGKGTGRRAWSGNRHDLWCRYVEKHLNSLYSAQILVDNLSEEDADYMETAWIAQCNPKTLVNWINMGRELDMDALNRYHRLRDANRSLIQQGRSMEKSDLEKASEMYVQAINAIAAYASIQYETGLIARLRQEEDAETGINGEIEAIDRLSICLTKLGRPQEAANQVDAYFSLYRRDLFYSVVPKIKKRIEKALEKCKG
jgi:hypothetical protein